MCRTKFLATRLVTDRVSKTCISEGPWVRFQRLFFIFCQILGIFMWFDDFLKYYLECFKGDAVNIWKIIKYTKKNWQRNEEKPRSNMPKTHFGFYPIRHYCSAHDFWPKLRIMGGKDCRLSDNPWIGGNVIGLLIFGNGKKSSSSVNTRWSIWMGWFEFGVKFLGDNS